MPKYPPEDPSATRAEAARALTNALVELDHTLTRLQAAAAWFLEAYGDASDAETVRMLRVPGGPPRGKPPVPSAMASEYPDSVTGDETGSAQ